MSKDLKTPEYGVVAGEVKRSEIAGHAIAGVGQNLVFGIWSGYMLLFFTDVFGISGAVAGLIMMLARFWDAVNDPIMGVIADRTRTKWGRYRPWLLFMAVPMVFFLALNFSAPALNPTGKIIFAAVTYIGMSMAYTAVDIPYWTLPTAMTTSVQKRSTIYSSSKITTTLASIVVSIAVIPLVNAFGGGDMAKGFFRTALLIGVIGALFYLLGFALIREHVMPLKQEKTGIKKAAKIIATNKPLLMTILSTLFAFTGTYLRQNMSMYYIQYNLGSLDLVPVFSVLALPGMLIGMAISSVLTKHLGGKKLYIYSCVLAGLLYIAAYFIGYSNMTAVMVVNVLAGIPTGITTVVMAVLAANTIEYSEWKTGSRNEGLISSSQTFSTKFVIAISGGLAGLILSLVNYIPAAVQPDSVLTTLHVTQSILPAILSFAGIIPMLFYDLTDERHAEIVRELEQRKG